MARACGLGVGKSSESLLQVKSEWQDAVSYHTLTSSSVVPPPRFFFLLVIAEFSFLDPIVARSQRGFWRDFYLIAA